MQAKDTKAQKSPREIAISRAIRMLTNLLRTVVFLLQNGIYVIGFRGRRVESGFDRIVVQVAASPYLQTLFADAMWLKQRHTGALTVHTWFAERFGIRIEWEEVCAH